MRYGLAPPRGLGYGDFDEEDADPDPPALRADAAWTDSRRAEYYGFRSEKDFQRFLKSLLD